MMGIEQNHMLMHDYDDNLLSESRYCKEKNTEELLKNS
jgi:hypothetical protein